MEPRFAAVRADLVRALQQGAGALPGRELEGEAKALEGKAVTVQGWGSWGPDHHPRAPTRGLPIFEASPRLSFALLY